VPSALRAAATVVLLSVLTLVPLVAPRGTQAARRAFAAPASVSGVPLALVRALRGEEGALAPPATRAGIGGLASGLIRLARVAPLFHSHSTSDIGSWAPAVAMLAGGGMGSTHAAVARALVRDVYERLGARPDWAAVDRAVPLAPHRTRGLAVAVDYPLAIPVPSPNRWVYHRGGRTIRYVVIHDTESACAAALNWLTNPRSASSAHFLVCRDGRVYQLVRVVDAAWHAGNTYINHQSIGIEHEGYAGQDYTPAQYAATVSILHWINGRMNLRLQWTRNAVFGHENVPGSDHTDPGPGWNWPLFMSMLRRGDAYDAGDPRLAVVLAPRAYIHACPLVGCAALGTANWGEQFSVRRRRPGWLGIDFAGFHGWLPAAATHSGAGTVVRIKARVVVRAAPSKNGAPVGPLAPGEAYASTLVDDSVDHRGWWLIEYAHRYGFVCACDTTPGYHATPVPVGTPALPHATKTPTPTAGAPVTATPSPTSSLTVAPTATPSPTTSPTDTVSPTPTSTPTPTLTPTDSPSPTETPVPSSQPPSAPVLPTLTAACQVQLPPTC